MTAGQRIKFGPFQLEPDNARLWRGDEAVVLRPRSFALLKYLVEHGGHLVTKQELLRTLWAGTVVSDGVLKVCVREIRRALGDAAGAPRFIETVPRQGYRFIAPVSTAAGVQMPAAEGEAFARIVGRQDELTKLQGWLEKAERGERQIVFVTGEPGIGKTTLVDLFLHRTGAEERMWVGRGQCLERYGAGEAYLPVLEALGRLGRGPGGTRLTKLLHQFAPSWLAQMPALVEDAELGALQRRVQGTTHERMLREITEAIEAFTADRGFVLVLEDLQWSDYSTLELVSYLAHRRERVRLMVVGTYRPADIAVAEHPLQGFKRELHARGQCEELALRMLTEAEVQEYLARSLVLDAAPPGWGQLIHQRTDGNPLFMVNLVDFAMAQGLVAAEAGEGAAAGPKRAGLEEIQSILPDNLRQMIQKQVEALGADVRAILEAASVAGVEFSAAAVAAAGRLRAEEVETHCDALARRGHVLCSREVEEWPDGTVSARYRFIHRFFQQVLYEHMGDAQRVRVHRLIGKRKEAGYRDRVHEIAGEIALHFERGRDYSRAVRYHSQAGEDELRRHAYQEAAQHIRKGLALLGELPEAPERAEEELVLQCDLGRALVPTVGPAAPEVQEAYARAWKLCQQAGETPRLGSALLGLAASHQVQGRLDVAEDVAAQALRLAERVHDRTVLLSAHCSLGTSLFLRGELAGAREHLEQSAALSVAGSESALAPFAFDVGVRSLASLALVSWIQGFPDEAAAKGRRAVELAGEVSSPFDLASTRLFAALVHQLRREEAEVRAQVEAAIAIATEQSFPLLVAGGTILRGWALAQAGRGAAGVSMMHEGLAGWRRTGTRPLRVYLLGLAAEAQGIAGETTEALATLDESLAEQASGGAGFCGAELHRLKGVLLLGHRADGAPGRSSRHRGRPVVEKERLAEAQACFQEALDIAHRQGAKSWTLRAALSMARSLRGVAEEREARRVLEETYGTFTEGFDTADLREAKTLLDELAS